MDAADLTAVMRASKASWGYPQAWLDAWEAALTMDAGAIDTMSVRVADDMDGRMLGFYALAGNGSELALEHLWVRPEAMGRGVGRALVEHAVALALAHGAEAVVIESDPNAEAFYRRCGAQRVGEVAAPMPGAEKRVLPLLRLELALPRAPGAPTGQAS